MDLPNIWMEESHAQLSRGPQVDEFAAHNLAATLRQTEISRNSQPSSASTIPVHEMTFSKSISHRPVANIATASRTSGGVVTCNHPPGIIGGNLRSPPKPPEITSLSDHPAEIPASIDSSSSVTSSTESSPRYACCQPATRPSYESSRTMAERPAQCLQYIGNCTFPLLLSPRAPLVWHSIDWLQKKEEEVKTVKQDWKAFATKRFLDEANAF